MPRTRIALEYRRNLIVQLNTNVNQTLKYLANKYIDRITNCIGIGELENYAWKMMEYQAEFFKYSNLLSDEFRLRNV